jgi:hypothetical protein
MEYKELQDQKQEGYADERQWNQHTFFIDFTFKINDLTVYIFYKFHFVDKYNKFNNLWKVTILFFLSKFNGLRTIIYWISEK